MLVAYDPAWLIDIVVAVQDSADEPAYVPALEHAGYTVRSRRHVQHYADAKSRVIEEILARPRPE